MCFGADGQVGFEWEEVVMGVPILPIKELLAGERERLEVGAESVPVPMFRSTLGVVLLVLNEFEGIEVGSKSEQILEPGLWSTKIGEN